MGNRDTLAALVLTRNEERHIHDCLASVRDFVDELIVFDSGSLDRTVPIAREVGARVETRPFDNYPQQRNAALACAQSDWVFFIDADERATVALGTELRSKLAGPHVGFWVPRRNLIFGKEIRHTGWWPDYQPRVLKKGLAHFDPQRQVHELVIWNGKAGYLTEPLIHHNYETLSQFTAKQSAYTHYEARIWYEEGKRARRRSFVGQPLREFYRRYVTLQGWRDGGHGLLLSGLMAYYAWVRQRMLWQMAETEHRGDKAVDK